MKTMCLSAAVLLTAISSTIADGARKPASHDELAERSGYTLSGAGPNHSKWTRVTVTNSAARAATAQTNSFVAISAGKNRWDGERWVPADPTLVVTNNSIVGMGTETEVRFSANIN